jgi:hypothetical protein
MKTSGFGGILHVFSFSTWKWISLTLRAYFPWVNSPELIPVAARSNAWVCGRSLAGIVGSNLAGAWTLVVSVVCCQVELSASA